MRNLRPFIGAIIAFAAYVCLSAACEAQTGSSNRMPVGTPPIKARTNQVPVRSGQAATRTEAPRQVVQPAVGRPMALRTLSQVNVGSPIIRLRDVVAPLDPDMPGWSRLGGQLVGLVPIDGHPMNIDRNRLAEAVRNSEELRDVAIEWIGPLTTTVNYKPELAKQNQPAIASTASTSLPQGSAAGSIATSQNRLSGPVLPSLTRTELRRIVQTIERAIATFLPEIEDDFTLEIADDQPDLAKLKRLAVVTNVELLAPLDEGDVPCRIVARSTDGPASADIVLTLTGHPTIVVAKTSLQRGHLIAASDLELKVIPRDRMQSGYITEMSEAIGKEVRSSLSADRPILHDRLGAPILIRRGEGVDLQVIGGGITVTTKARAMSDGAASELIELETLQPRKRLYARVVGAGLAEIVSRAPTTQR